MTFELRSPVFSDRQPIPAKYTADGDDVSPPLEWSGAPEGTRSFLLVVEDPDAPTGTFRHWGLYNIGADRTALPEGAGTGGRTAGEAGMGVNDFGEPRYRGPAPPEGHGTHRYRFRLAALDVNGLSEPVTAKVEDIWSEAQSHVLGEAELVGVYER